MIVLIGFKDLETSLFRKASTELGIDNRITYFGSMETMCDAFSDASEAGNPLPFPRVIVLNIDAPDQACERTLISLKRTEKWGSIPVLGYGFLEDPKDISTFYARGGASCIRKPNTYAELVQTTRAAMGYWLSMSTMPCDYLREA